MTVKKPSVSWDGSLVDLIPFAIHIFLQQNENCAGKGFILEVKEFLNTFIGETTLPNNYLNTKSLITYYSHI